jgi:hypothetical protein
MGRSLNSRSVRLLVRLAGAGLTTLAITVGAASCAQASEPQGAGVIAIVNEQRAANGIPPITTLDPEYASAWCPDEDHGPSGAGEFGRVSASEDAWSATKTPYSTAPLHQFIIYAPLASAANDVHTPNGVDCMGVGEPDPTLAVATSPPVFYAFVNERGPHAAVSSELAREGPTTPQQELGEPINTRTGPQILLFAVGLGFRPQATSITLRTAAGAPVSGVKIAAQFEGGVLVPPPLKAGTSYSLEVQWTGEPAAFLSFEGEPTPSVSATQRLSFATAAAPKPKRRARRRHGR